MTQPEWSERVAVLVAEQVRRYRQARGLSAQQLADECAGLGLPIKRSVLANFESGRRTTITLAELLVLARALGVPPILLVFPLGRETTTEVLPEVERPTWAVAKWFAGEAAFPTAASSGKHDYLAGEHADVQTYFDTAGALMRHREHDRLVENLRWALGRVPIIADAAANAENAEAKSAHEERLVEARAVVAERERLVVEHRRKMWRSGVVPPPLDPALAHLDNGGYDANKKGDEE